MFVASVAAHGLINTTFTVLEQDGGAGQRAPPQTQESSRSREEWFFAVARLSVARPSDCRFRFSRLRLLAALPHVNLRQPAANLPVDAPPQGLSESGRNE